MWCMGIYMLVPDLHVSLEETCSDYIGHEQPCFMFIVLHWNWTAEANITENFLLHVVSLYHM